MTGIRIDGESLNEPETTPSDALSKPESSGRRFFDIIQQLPVCASSELRERDARALADDLAAALLPFARLIECRRVDSAEIVILEVEVELVQDTVYDIRHIERMAVVFTVGQMATTAPEVLALREDFPTVPHLNLRSFDYPRSLCLYDVPFRDIRAQWTPARFLALLREWLRLTSRGNLHASDQSLEPILMEGEGWVVLPHSIRDEALANADSTENRPLPASLVFVGRPNHLGKPVLVASRLAQDEATDNPPAAVAAILCTSPRVHGTIRRTPENFSDLHRMLAEEGDDLIAMVSTTLRNGEWSKQALDAKLLLVVLIPKRRAIDGETETIETWAFFTDKTVRDFGICLGVWGVSDGEVGLLIGQAATPVDADLAEINLLLAYPFFSHSRSKAAELNSSAAVDDRRIMAVGGGALGSQVILNEVRAAFGKWTVVDDDFMLPHNLGRHVLPGNTVGFPKAHCLEVVANGITDDPPVHRGLALDVLAPGENAQALSEAFSEAVIIADFSASVTVARFLARDVTADARRISLFLNPSGTDLTLLAEDISRTISLDVLEMQYYRALVQNSALLGALTDSRARIRYGRSCRHLSVQLPQALVALFGGIGARAFQQAVATPTAQLRVWRVDPTTLGVTAVDVRLAPVRSSTVNGWQILTDTALLERLAELRSAKLPNETGGVLVGAYDLARKLVYVIDTVPSPGDSHEYPTAYIRGSEGLREAVERIQEATAGQLHYIGEWHSHPVGHPCLPSLPDRQLFSWLTVEMAKDGLPALMLIVGDDGFAVPYFGRIVDTNGQPSAFTSPQD